ncbi:MAG: hypothetical protein Q8N53_07955 [Longimicrobiales bacterium]|nr:hypothetical protein [Longimicrobiales bacterium]
MHGARNAMRWVAGYYLATPVFAVADLVFGVPVRVATVLPEISRLAYYSAAFALGLLCRARPVATPWVGILESTTNLLILFLSILLPIWGAADALTTGAPLAVSLTPLSAANAFISGSAMILSFRRSQDAAWRRPR